MKKTTTVKNWSASYITKSKELNVPTVKEFLNNECECNPNNKEDQEYIYALKSQELSDFFMKRFKKEITLENGTNLSNLTDLERREILKVIEEKYQKTFVEYKDLFEIYIEKLILSQLSDNLRKQKLLETKNESTNEYSIHTRDYLTKTKKIEAITTPVIARIK